MPSNLAALANGAMARALEIDDVIDAFPLKHSSGELIIRKETLRIPRAWMIV